MHPDLTSLSVTALGQKQSTQSIGFKPKRIKLNFNEFIDLIGPAGMDWEEFKSYYPTQPVIPLASRTRTLLFVIELTSFLSRLIDYHRSQQLFHSIRVISSVSSVVFLFVSVFVKKPAIDV